MMSNERVVLFTVLMILLWTKMRGGNAMDMSQPRVLFYDIGSKVGRVSGKVIANPSGPAFNQNDRGTRVGQALRGEAVIPAGCYRKNTALIPEDEWNAYKSDEKPYEKDSAYSCQKLCQEQKWCYFFLFNEKFNLCYMKMAPSPFYVRVNERSNNFEDIRFRHTNEFIFGPKYCNARCPGQCRCESGVKDHPLGGQKLNKHGFCEHYCSGNKFPASGQCGITHKFKAGVNCKGCRDYSGSQIACSNTDLRVDYHELFKFGCSVRPPKFTKLHYCMIEVLDSNGKMMRCVYEKRGGKLVQMKKYCPWEVLQTKVKQIGTGKDWCGFEIRLSKLNGMADNWKGFRVGLGFRWTTSKNGFELSKNNQFFKLTIKHIPSSLGELPRDLSLE